VTSEDSRSERPPATSDADLRRIIDTIPGFVWCAAADGGIEFLNQRGLAYTGFSLEQIRGWNWRDTNILHPDDVQTLMETWGAIVESAEEGEIQARMRRFDGVYRWFLFRVAPLRDQSGRLVAWFGIDLEIDERKRSQDQLRRSESYLAEAQTLSRTGSFGWNVATGDLVWSAETYRILDYERSVTPTLDLVFDRVHPEDRIELRATLDRARADLSDFDSEHRLLMPDGPITYVHVVAHAVRDASGVVEFVGAVCDVTAARVAEEQIRRNEQELRQIVDAIPQLITVLTPDGATIYINKRAVEFTGLSLRDIQDGASRTRLTHPDDLERTGHDVRRGLARGAAFETEQRVLRNDGQYRWFLNRFNPLLDEAGHVIRWYVTGIDIEDRKQAEERIRSENFALREEIDRNSMFEELVGASPALRTVLSNISRVAPTDSTVLITGETGTGKELVARAIHKRSLRSQRPFVSVNCAAVPASLITSELFGHEKGAFTGAMHRRQGRFELAEGGTLFIDEVGELLHETQMALLRVLQEREFERVGGSRPMRTDVRIIAATNRDLQAAVSDGSFRADLFYRLNVFPLEVPALRDRVADIPLLVEYFIHRYAKRAGKRVRGVTSAALDRLSAHYWPGNIRELQNIIERAVIVSDTETLTVDERWLPPASPSHVEVIAQPENRGRENDAIVAALRASKGRVAGPFGAAAKLGMPSSTLESKIKSLHIDKRRFKTAVTSEAG